MTAVTDTHHYDGHMEATIHPLRERLNLVRQLDRQTKCAAMRVFLTQWAPRACARTLQIIVLDAGRGGQDNWDGANQLDAGDLLYILAVFVRDCRDELVRRELLQELCVQCVDMQGGMCAQGRTTRLLQLITAFNVVQHKSP